MHRGIFGRALGRVWRQEDGQDLLEYALLIALVAMVAIGAVETVGNTINDVFWEAIAVAVPN
jgi:Flp pilus assembly pilin Flp